MQRHRAGGEQQQPRHCPRVSNTAKGQRQRGGGKRPTRGVEMCGSGNGIPQQSQQVSGSLPKRILILPRAQLGKAEAATTMWGCDAARQGPAQQSWRAAGNPTLHHFLLFHCFILPALNKTPMTSFSTQTPSVRL